MMKVCLTGGTGFIGTKISKFFKQNNFEVVNISRKDLSLPISEWKHKVDGAELLINLAGASIIKKWTSQYKKTILNSRLKTTQKIVEACQQVENKPRLVISASAVGIYDEVEIHDEFSDALANDFLADVCKQWERTIAPIASENTRLAIVRIGIVLDKDDGALAKMLPSFKFGAGAIIGNGEQAFPCIHISDLLSVIWFLYKNEKSAGVYNLVAPDIVSNKYFSKKIGEKLNRPVLFKAPKWALQLALGEGACTLTQGQKVKPSRLLDMGFPYQFPTVDSILDDLLK